MRPDQHKQKKNTQYKKKHGVTDKNKEAQNSKDTKGQKVVKGHSKEGPKPEISKKGQSQNERRSKVESDTSGSSDSDDEDQTALTFGKQFQRRTVVSNWDRYDLPRDDETTQSKGEDFSKLLQAAGGSTSQFRFKGEEEDWETTEQSVDLSLDLQDLSTSLNCVPLYKVLRLNTDLFTAEQIEEFDRKSLENQRKFQKKTPESLPSPSKKTPESLPSPSKKTPESSPSKTVPVISNEKVKNKEKESLQTNALDELLDSVVLETSPKNGTSQKPNVDVVSSLENDLDDLLSSGHQEEIVYTVKKDPEKLQQTTSKTSQESNDLEDWLDSVLDS